MTTGIEIYRYKGELIVSQDGSYVVAEDFGVIADVAGAGAWVARARARALAR
jgi:hypothetical protein